jgi:hypothetical protein
MAESAFVSYSRRDTEFVNHLVADLEGQKLKIWLDRGAIQVGEAWRKSIVEGIDKSEVFIIVLSPNSVASENVGIELTIAQDKHKRRFPVLYQQCNIPTDMQYQLAGVQHIDFTANQYYAAFAMLVAALRGALAPNPIPAPTPNPNPPPTPNIQFQLAGTWQVQIMHPLTGAVLAHGQFTYSAMGEFQGSLNTINGMMQAQGHWQMMGAQIVMQGTHVLAMMPFQVLPYNLGLQVVAAGPAGFNAVSTAGEQVAFQRIA